MSIFEIKFKHRFLYNIAIFVLLSHFFLFFIFSFLNKPLKIAFLVNKSAVNLSFKVDYMQKRTAKKIDSDKLKTKKLKSAKSKGLGRGIISIKFTYPSLELFLLAISRSMGRPISIQDSCSG